MADQIRGGIVANLPVSASVIAMILIVMSFSANLLLKRIATARK